MKPIPYKIYPGVPTIIEVQDKNGDTFEIPANILINKIQDMETVDHITGLPKFLIDFSTEFKTRPKVI